MIECPGCGGFNVLFIRGAGVDFCECWECGEAWFPEETRVERAMTPEELKQYFELLDSQR